jgi:hypothetical protein
MTTPPCIVCGRQMRSVVGRHHNQPMDGLSFASHGSYGSTVFDPMNGSMLEINVCDPCVQLAAADGRVLHYQPPAARTSRKPIPTLWTGDD